MVLSMSRDFYYCLVSHNSSKEYYVNAVANKGANASEDEGINEHSRCVLMTIVIFGYARKNTIFG